ncbi:MAG: YraN family protein [Pseudomonadota bacterium]
MIQKRNYLAGIAAEQSVAQTYRNGGCTIQHIRWCAMGGELDIVAHDNGQLVFCEVKHSKTFDQAAQYVSPAKQQRIMQTAQAYLAKEGYNQNTDIRFDVALVDGQGQTHLIKNAFMT